VKAKHFYLILCFFGIALPYSQFIPFIAQNGLNLRLFIQQLFADRISGFFGWDVIVTALVIVVLILSEGKRQRIRFLWLPFASTFMVGPSLGLPLFLYMQEISLQKMQGGSWSRIGGGERPRYFFIIRNRVLNQ